MTNLQLFIAIIVPMLFNGALIALLNNNMNQRFNDFAQRFQSFETRLELLIGKVAELTDRVTRLEEHGGR
jgi:hypothetical protein